MRRYRVTEGTRAEVLAELSRLGRDRLAQVREDKAREIARAWNEVNDGETWVALGENHIYSIVEDDLGEPERNPDQAAIDAERDVRVMAIQDALVED